MSTQCHCLIENIQVGIISIHMQHLSSYTNYILACSTLDGGHLTFTEMLEMLICTQLALQRLILIECQTFNHPSKLDQVASAQNWGIKKDHWHSVILLFLSEVQKKEHPVYPMTSAIFGWRKGGSELVWISYRLERGFCGRVPCQILRNSPCTIK